MQNEPAVTNDSRTIEARARALDWERLAQSLEDLSFGMARGFLDADECAELRAMYDESWRFRSTITMARHGFGRGEYRYFAYDLPAPVAALRQALYSMLAGLANGWAARLGTPAHWPTQHGALLERCRAAGQHRPTPLLLRYGAGDFNCLHQDLYGSIHFPLQATLLLDHPGDDFEGGEVVLVESRPRQQSRCEVVTLGRGDLVVFPVRERPRMGTRGVYRTTLRHGVSTIRAGRRHTLGIIFHDAQ